jgi:hypothetical protein
MNVGKAVPGPFQSGRALRSPFLVVSNAWYSTDIRCAELTNLDVTFMDDSIVRFGPEQITSVLTAPEANDCR